MADKKDKQQPGRRGGQAEAAPGRAAAATPKAKPRRKAKSEARQAARDPQEGSGRDGRDEAAGAAEEAGGRRPSRTPEGERPRPRRKPKAPARRRGAAPRPGVRGRGPGSPPRQRERPATRPVVRAQAKYVRSSARKARLVMEHVRGKSVGDARALLRHSPRGVARDVERLLDVGDRQRGEQPRPGGRRPVREGDLRGRGADARRFRPRAQGRATRIRKRTSHLTVALSTKE